MLKRLLLGGGFSGVILLDLVQRISHLHLKFMKKHSPPYPSQVHLLKSLSSLHASQLPSSLQFVPNSYQITFSVPTSAMSGFAQASDLQAWQQLQQHHTTLGRNIVLKDFFEKDPSRFEKFSRTFKNTADKSEILFDFSKNFITEETLSLLIQLAKEAGVEKLRDEMFAGGKINFTEKRAVYHVALRNVTNQPMQVDGKSVVEDVNEVLEHMKVFSEQVRSGEWKGYTGKKIKTIVNIGIGGSDL